MNDAYGGPSVQTLPFDLVHLRWPLRFTLQKNASAEQKNRRKTKISCEFEGSHQGKHRNNITTYRPADAHIP